MEEHRDPTRATRLIVLEEGELLDEGELLEEEELLEEGVLPMHFLRGDEVQDEGEVLDEDEGEVED